eukprot:Unigene18410_Nuclearia_a/m.53024 Unigene18410_Nuclearia_a/g.53024  ORF Unigene18410_Nuclearia_a/g.53024 Unigene18410_Nuclearia_a/m.53024 type:complete len:165 (-) Unigene18410_Nuclearia_a:105-599(-)
MRAAVRLGRAGCVCLARSRGCRPPFDAHSQDVLNVKIKAGKFARLAKFSDELNRAVRSMLELDPAARPTVDDLLRLLPVRVCVRERKLNQHYVALKKKEEQLNAREAQLEARERELAARELVLRDGGTSPVGLALRPGRVVAQRTSGTGSPTGSDAGWPSPLAL